jgi:hypothetical protein
MLTRATEHLEERFSVVGVTERFDESLLLTGRAFGWNRLHYFKVNVAPQSDRTPPSAAALEEIRQRNALDVALYRWVVERLDRIIADDPGIPADLERLRRSNSRYRPVGFLTEELPRSVAARIRR